MVIVIVNNFIFYENADVALFVEFSDSVELGRVALVDRNLFFGVVLGQLALGFGEVLDRDFLGSLGVGRDEGVLLVVDSLGGGLREGW